MQKYNFVVVVFCFHLPRYPHHISTATADSTVVVAVLREEEEEEVSMRLIDIFYLAYESSVVIVIVCVCVCVCVSFDVCLCVFRFVPIYCTRY